MLNKGHNWWPLCTATFSSDGETLYVAKKFGIKAYSTTTSDFINELEIADSKIISIFLSPDNSSTIVGCTDAGEIINWNCHNGLITFRKKCKLFKGKEMKKIKTFHIIRYTSSSNKPICCACLSYITYEFNKTFLNIDLVDMIKGSRILKKQLELKSDEYYIDIVGNYGENLIAVGEDINLFIISLNHGLRHNRLKTGRRITQVRGHPEEECVAVGDESGRVVVWRNISQITTIRSMYHWHSLPVIEIMFSKFGGYMFTGGNECVLVKWPLDDPKNNSFLPRLSAPIMQLVVSPDNTYVAIFTADNAISIINPQNQIISVIQNFTCVSANTSNEPFPAGLHVDPKTNAMVLNSTTGRIQFYNTHTKNLLYNVHITAQNVITGERNTVLTNTEVVKIAINSDGSWLVTAEEWKNEKITHYELRLKFWNYDVTKQCFSLVSCIEHPHENGINALKFRPKSSFGDNEEYVISVGKDGKFKLWYFAELEENTRRWRCHSYGYYRNLQALDAGFSTDGSLVGVGFDSILTLWDPETNELKSSLSYCLHPQPITRVEFGKQEVCHLVVIASLEHLAVWDLFSLTVKWSVAINLIMLTADPLSIYMAAFTTDNTLIVFSPGSTEIVFKKTNVVENDDSILAACFVPNIDINNNDKWQNKSTLYFIDSNQEILSLETKSKATVALENLTMNRDLSKTSFSGLLPAERISNIDKSTSYVHDYLRKSEKGISEMLLSTPAHTLPPMSMLCMPYLLSLLGKTDKNKQNDEKSQRFAIKNNNFVDEDSDEEDNPNEIKPKNIFNVKEKKTINEVNELMEVEAKKDEDEETNVFSNLDWNFLRDVLPSSEAVN